MQTLNLFIRSIALVAGIAVANGCSMSSSPYGIQASVNPASVVQIKQRLQIPDQKARVYIQNGIEATLGNIDKLSTYCSVLMQNLHVKGEPKLIVSPGQFEIINVRQYNDLLPYRRIFVASTSREWTRDHPSNVIFRVEMRLKSARQPNVRALICAKHVNNYRPKSYPTLSEIRVALGDAIEIRTP